MDEQREQPRDERPEVAGEVDEAELEQAAGGGRPQRDINDIYV